MPDTLFGAYIGALGQIAQSASVTTGDGRELDLDTTIRRMGNEMRAAHERGNRIFFVGNGGSAGICSHMATDYSKNGGMRASALNDGATLTCLGNDYGYESVFAKQIEWHARPGDILVAISSSGRSQNILNAVEAARGHDCVCYTLSGFDSANPLRRLGDINVYLANREYGFVEVGHLAVLHAVLDIQMGWRKSESTTVDTGSAEADVALNKVV